MKKKKMSPEGQRSLVKSRAISYGFEELSNLKKVNNGAEEVITKIVSKGIFKSKDQHKAIFCKFIDPKKLWKGMDQTFENRIEVSKYYVGEQYLLCLTERRTYAYNVNYYKSLLSLIKEIYLDMDSQDSKLSIGLHPTSSFHILFIETEIADFAVAGLLGNEQPEEERVILSNKLEASQPFFKFKPPIHFDWNKLVGKKDQQFERICEKLLQKEKDIIKITPIGKTRAADRGRDFEVIEKVEGFGERKETKWLVQCKFSEHSISPSIIAGWTDRIIEHSYDGFWLMTNNDVTPNLFDQFKDIERNNRYAIKTKLWQRSDFEIKLSVHAELFMKGDIFKVD